ncbi:MAG TPA: hypothetical protein PLY87_02745, partial [Planctomycetaceae bacterium]|nr:hypothetical protein [Planctomycetaceae bacterium]
MMPCIFVTMISGIKVCVLGALGVTFSSTILLAADQEPVAKSFRDRVCDQAILADGARLTGVAINESPTRIALRTVRLKADAPDLFKQEIEPALAKQQTDQNQQLINILQKRIDQLKQDSPNDRQQIGLLEE